MNIHNTSGGKRNVLLSIELLEMMRGAREIIYYVKPVYLPPDVMGTPPGMATGDGHRVLAFPSAGSRNQTNANEELVCRC